MKHKKEAKSRHSVDKYTQGGFYEMSKHMKAEKVFLAFKNQKDFGNFCVALNSDRVPFELAGFQTVIFTKEDFDDLAITSEKAYRAYQKYRRQAVVETNTQAQPTRLTGRRYLPTEEEAEELLKEFAEGF